MLLKYCEIVAAIEDDTKQFATHLVSYNGKTDTGMMALPPGYHTNARRGELGLLLCVGGPGAKVVLPIGTERPPLKEGEIAIHHAPSGSTIKMDENGNIEITAANDISVTAKNATVTADQATVAGNTTLDGDVSITGDLVVTGSTSVAGITSNNVNIGSTHVHVGPASAPPGGVVPTGIPIP